MSRPDTTSVRGNPIRVSTPDVSTYVVQSCPDACPSWMRRCMRTVEQWASSHGYRYRRIVDAEFLGLAPGWYRDKAHAIQPVTDLARVEAALRYLSADAERVVWMDADVLVFAPGLVLPEHSPVAFTREVWCDVRRPSGSPQCVERVNNSVLVATDVEFLARYRDTCLRLAAEANAPLWKAMAGTQYLTDRHREERLPLVRHVGNLSPHVLRAVLEGERSVLDFYRTRVGERLLAANLCASFENKDYFGTLNTTAVYEQVVTQLLATEGALLA